MVIKEHKNISCFVYILLIEAFSEAIQTFKMVLSVVNRKKLHIRCLTRFWKRLSLLYSVSPQWYLDIKVITVLFHSTYSGSIPVHMVFVRATNRTHIIFFFNPLHKKWSFRLRISSVKVTKCTVETLHEKLYFLCSDRTTKQFINIIYHYCIIAIIFIITIILLYSFLVMTNVTHIFQHFSPFSHFRACSLPGHKTSFSSLDKACWNQVKAVLTWGKG